MQQIIGEFIATYIMMTLGLGINVIISYIHDPLPQNKWLIGGYWGLSILLASFIGTYFCNTANLSPLFSFAQTINHQITWTVMFGEIISQIISTWLASKTVGKMWRKWFDSISLKLQYFATVPKRQHHRVADFFWELFGTALIVASSLFLNQFTWPWWFKIIWSSALMWLVIACVSPITGAALNPIRDLVPREYFSNVSNNNKAQWSYSIVPLLGPTCGCLLVLAISKMI